MGLKAVSKGGAARVELQVEVSPEHLEATQAWLQQVADIMEARVVRPVEMTREGFTGFGVVL